MQAMQMAYTTQNEDLVLVAVTRQSKVNI